MLTGPDLEMKNVLYPQSIGRSHLHQSAFGADGSISHIIANLFDVVDLVRSGAS